MTQAVIQQRDEQLRAFIAQRIAKAHEQFSKDGYSLAQHTALLREADELLNTWTKVKAALSEGGE